MTEQFFSEYEEDLWIAQNLPLPPSGVFVDIGAAYPLLRSNTAFLRARGWRGIAVDGNPFYRDQWPPGTLITAVVSGQPFARFDCHHAPDLSGIRPEGEPAPCRTLESLLLENHIDGIDLLSLDCEGGEFDAICSMNIAAHHPAIIVSEYNTFGVGEDYRVRDYLLDMGYQQAHQTVANLIFQRL